MCVHHLMDPDGVKITDLVLRTPTLMCHTSEPFRRKADKVTMIQCLVCNVRCVAVPELNLDYLKVKMSSLEFCNARWMCLNDTLKSFNVCFQH